MAIRYLCNEEINVAAGKFNWAALNGALAALKAIADSFYKTVTISAISIKALVASFAVGLTNRNNSLKHRVP